MFCLTQPPAFGYSEINPLFLDFWQQQTQSPKVPFSFVFPGFDSAVPDILFRSPVYAHILACIFILTSTIFFISINPNQQILIAVNEANETEGKQKK